MEVFEFCSTLTPFPGQAARSGTCPGSGERVREASKRDPLPLVGRGQGVGVAG